jgi:subtilisin family serine protease
MDGRDIKPISHGTQVAATAAGNHVTITASNFNTPQTITGVAPRARLAMYKVKKELLGQSTIKPPISPTMLVLLAIHQALTISTPCRLGGGPFSGSNKQFVLCQ